MVPVLRIVLAGIVAACVIGASGCGGVTYQREAVAGAVQDLLTHEGLQASVRLLEHTLAVKVDYPGALRQADGQISLGADFDKVLQIVIPQIHRVLLSTNAPMDFYVILIGDPALPGAYLTMVRYLDDVRRAHANMLDVPEMYSRTVFDLNYVGAQPVTIEQYVPRDIQLEEFLSWQLARRIQTRLTEELQATGAAEVGRCGGEFRNGEFAFTLNVAPAGDALDEGTARDVFQAATTVIAKVLSSYRFDKFSAVRLILPTTGQHLVLPKARLDVFQ